MCSAMCERKKECTIRSLEMQLHFIDDAYTATRAVLPHAQDGTDNHDHRETHGESVYS